MFKLKDLVELLIINFLLITGKGPFIPLFIQNSNTTIQVWFFFSMNKDFSTTFLFHYIYSWDETISFVYFVLLPFHFVSSDDSDTYVKSRDSGTPIRENNLYWPTLSCIGRVVLSVSQRQFSSYLCKHNSS